MYLLENIFLEKVQNNQILDRAHKCFAAMDSMEMWDGDLSSKKYLNDLAHHDMMIYYNHDVRVVESRMIQVMTNTGGDETTQFEVGKILC